MALLEALTYECWIPFKTTHFGCVLELIEHHHPQVYVLANEPPLHLRRQKLSIQYCLRYPLPHRIQHTVQSLTQNLNLHFNANQMKFPLWEFDFTLTCRLLALEEKTLYSVLRYQYLFTQSITMYAVATPIDPLLCEFE